MSTNSKKCNFFALVIYFGVSYTALAQPVFEGNQRLVIKQEVDKVMSPFLAQDNAPGAIVGISIHGRREFFQYGSSNDNGTPFTSTTLVEIGSCTKVFTTTLFALAISRHQIEPDQSAQLHMPSGYTLQPVARQITPRQLAEFISGMPDDPSDAPRNLRMKSIGMYTEKDFLRWASHWQPVVPPPAAYLYSNAGIGLLSYLVADATGIPWNKQLHSEILGPLGMLDTVVHPREQQLGRIAQGHRKDGERAPEWPEFAWFAAGALRSTALDMLRFGEANLGHKQIDLQVVPDELLTAMKVAQSPAYMLPNGRGKQGMAWVTNLGEEEGSYIEVLKNGGTAGFSTVILINPTKDIAIFIALNQGKSNPARAAIEIGRHLP